MKVKLYDVYYYPRGAECFRSRIQVTALNVQDARKKARRVSGYTDGRMEVERVPN
jgi:hypothetical protein